MPGEDKGNESQIGGAPGDEAGVDIKVAKIYSRAPQTASYETVEQMEEATGQTLDEAAQHGKSRSEHQMETKFESVPEGTIDDQ